MCVCVRDIVPGLMVRLNKDQECYDFIKWWAITGDDAHYGWGDMDLPYLYIENADVFEPVDAFKLRFNGLGHAVSLLLLLEDEVAL